MTTQEPDPPFKTKRQEFTYEVFIDEVRVLYAEPEKFSVQEANAQSGTFRRWKRRVEDALERVEALGYDPKLAVRTRMFDVMYSGSKDKAFMHDLVETLQEMEILIEGFDKYGAPKNAKLEGEQRAKLKMRAPMIESPAAAPPACVPPPAPPAPAPAPVPLVLPATEKMTWNWLKQHVPISWWWKIGLAFGAVVVGAFAAGKYADSVDKALHPEHQAVQVQPMAPISLPSKAASKP